MKIICTYRNWGRCLKRGFLMTVSIAALVSWNPSPGPFAQEKPQSAQTAPAAVSLVSPTEQAEKDGTALRISLKELTKLALQNNLDIASRKPTRLFTSSE